MVTLVQGVLIVNRGSNATNASNWRKVLLYGLRMSQKAALKYQSQLKGI
jgi:hypothetical protein